MNDQTAVATAPPERPDLVTEVMTIAGRGEIERITARVTIPPDYQYAITKGVNVGTRDNPQWEDRVAKIGLTIDAYEYMNRVLGVSFFFPEKVANGEGQLVPNPIWTPPDFTTVLMGATWINPMGQQVVSYELVSTDFYRIYQDKRANSFSATPMRPPDWDEGDIVVPTFDKNGDMNLVLDTKDEMKAYKELTRMRSLGPRYAQTVGRVRLLKQASGIRSLPGVVLRSYPLTLTGFRDPLDARKRIEAAAKTEHAMYGRPADDESFATPDEMTAAGGAEDHEGPIEADAGPTGTPDFAPDELAKMGL